MKFLALIVSAGWYVQKHDILDLEPSAWSQSECAKDHEFSDIFDDELFVATHLPSGYRLEAGWKGWNDPKGTFQVHLLKPKQVPGPQASPTVDLDYEWDQPVRTFQTKSTAELGAKLGEYMLELTQQY